MKKILLLISILCIAQTSFAAILYVKDSRNGIIGKIPETLRVAVNWEDGQIEKAIARDGRFHGIDSHFNPIEGISWVDRGMFYWVRVQISPLSTSHQFEIFSGGWCTYDGRERRASQAPLEMES